MKKLKIFYLERCPFCKKAFQYIEELKQEHPEFKSIAIETIEESKEPEIANSYDYYYVPTFYVDDQKVHEGGIYKPEVKAILQSVLQS